MKYLPIHSSSSIWLRYDNLWTNLNQFCVNIMELIVFITHNWLYGRFYISEFTCFSFFSPDLCCDTWARFVQILLRFGRLLRIGGVVANGVAFSLCSYGVSLYCTIPRQFILHLHRYNILRSPRGTQFWVSRSKKCLVKEWQYLVFLGTP